ncbi:hypothetical protein FS749_015173 [Ceratobasidium sp. UAMH 11750]|nr:hypothetical protein FS749_015173 [Ceratobasidium sp. UAMH 11750]
MLWKMTLCIFAVKNMPAPRSAPPEANARLKLSLLPSRRNSPAAMRFFNTHGTLKWNGVSPAEYLFLPANYSTKAYISIASKRQYSITAMPNARIADIIAHCP